MNGAEWIAAVGGALGAIGGVVGAGAGIWAVRKAAEANNQSETANRIAGESRDAAMEANRLSGSANSIAAESQELATEANRLAVSANQLSERSNQIAIEANVIAHRAINAQADSDRLAHAATLVLVPTVEGIRDQDINGIFLRIPLRNLGQVDAFDVRVRLKRTDADRWYSEDDPRVIRAGERVDFRLPVGRDFFRRNEGGCLIDYGVTYKDRLSHHDKRFRVQLSGRYETGWSFKPLDILLDGKRIPFQDAPELAPGVAFEEHQQQQ